MGFRDLGFRDLGFRDLGFRDLGFRGLGFRDQPKQRTMQRQESSNAYRYRTPVSSAIVTKTPVVTSLQQGSVQRPPGVRYIAKGVAQNMLHTII